MRLPCEMIRDLLPLFHDGACSEVSDTLIREHLNTCEDCARMLNNLETEIAMPKLEADEAKPIKKIKRKMNKTTWLKGLLIGLAAFFLWFHLTQSSSVPITADEYVETNVYRFSNGMYYLEFRSIYDLNGLCADICRSDDGSVHITEYRPLLARRDAENGTVRDYLIDPENNVMYTDSGKEVPLTAFYVGCPDRGDALLVWSADMDVPLATPEMEKEHLYQFVFR